MAQTNRVGTHATKVMCTNGHITVAYHDTVVVNVTPSEITLDTGGWFTPTTKRRMNQTSNQFGLDYGVYQKDGRWFVTYHGTTYPFAGETITLPRREN